MMRWIIVALVLVTFVSVSPQTNAQPSTPPYSVYLPTVFVPSPPPSGKVSVIGISYRIEPISDLGDGNDEAVTIWGEVYNGTGYMVDQVDITAQLIDDQLHPVAQSNDYIATHYLAAGDKTCFALLLITSAAKWGDSVNHRITIFPPVYGNASLITPPVEVPPITILNEQVDPNNPQGYTVEGQIRNDNDFTITNEVVPILTIYKGSVVYGCNRGYSDYNLDPGQIVNYGVSIQGDFPDVTSYRLQMDTSP
jgi:hypothetical protein